MNFAVFADEIAIPVDEDGCVVVASAYELGEAEIEAEAEGFRFVEEWLGRPGRHLALEKGVHLCIVVDPPPGKKRCECELREDDEIAPAGLRLVQE